MFRLAVSLRLASAMMLAAFSLLVASGPSNADPALHRVKYTVTAERPFHAEIYYRDSEPLTFADYSHNPYQFSPNIEADVGPDQPWILNAMLKDPAQWAMVVVTSGLSTEMAMFHCQLEVDGVVAATDDGPKGALCSLRHW
jgi:hypothetical protein